ncbi:MAG TPA: type I-U CRISPR-associated protein Csx17 [Streptosporangiaceae bacterium]|nr:type I-U CRISPR-associated protein Csx17 [Streptosporangiaceae bacterium]
MTRHVCPGLRPEPLGSYLAGLGLIRLLGEQADPAATACWTGDGLVVDTAVPDLAGWLVREYVPTPVLSPWNSGSGFGAKDKEPKRRLKDLVAHPSPRLGELRTAITAAQQVVGDARAAGWIKPDGKGGEKVTDKARIVLEFRNRCPDALLSWIDATVVLTGDQPFFPPLLGTGGNDGRLDFSTNFHEQLLQVLDENPKGRLRSLRWAQDALAGAETERLDEGAVGQFDPAAAGGQGSSPFGSAASLVNPWAYVLLTEGALLFASGTARRYQHAAGRAAAPFTVRFSPDGSDSGAAGEVSTSRGEVWVPVWDRPYSIAEIRQLFGEARASWRGRPAQRAVDFYAATRTLGVARGISEFVRYGLQRRNGLAYVAVPLARVEVSSKPEVRLAARVEDWVARWVRSADASSVVGVAARRFDAAHLAYARDGGPRALAGMLAALTSLEQAAGRSGRMKERAPVRRTPAAQDFLAEFAKAECAELRVAVGIASCATRPGGGTPARSMRQILLPIDPGGSPQQPGRWRDASLVTGFGLRSIQQVLADVLTWRSRTAADEDSAEPFRGVPTFRRGIPVPAADLHAFARGLLDEGELDLWLRACLALDWRGVQWSWRHQPDMVIPVPLLGLLQPLAHGLASADDAPNAPKLALEPDWASRLTAGQVRAVHEEAVARLRQAGWQAVPFSPELSQPTVAGVDIAAALVPRCREPKSMLQRYFAVRVRDESAEGDRAATTGRAEALELEIPEPHTPELAKELS